MAAYRDGRYSEAQHRFDEIASLGGPHAANAALYGAQALRRVSGCPTAAPRFEEVHSRYPGSVGSDAAWQAADCYRSLGELARARQNYEQLSARPQLQDPRQRSDRRARPTGRRSRARRAQGRSRCSPHRSSQRQSLRPSRRRTSEASRAAASDLAARSSRREERTRGACGARLETLVCQARTGALGRSR